MIKLYGAPLSNYYNMIKVALIEKGLSFEEVAGCRLLSEKPDGQNSLY